MPRASRHKSSKHTPSSSKDARDYSDSETTRKPNHNNKDDSITTTTTATVRVSKETEKRKVDLKDSGGNGGDYVVVEEYTSSSSKRRKEKIDHDVASDSWNGEEGRFEVSRKSSKAVSESKSKRRDEVDAEDAKKSSGKSRKEGREGGSGVRDKERKNKDRLGTEQVVKITESIVGLGSDNQLEKRVKKRKSGSGDGDKQHDGMGDLNGRRLSSRDDYPKDGKTKDEKHESDRYKDKHRDDVDRDIKHRDERQRDGRPDRNHTKGRSDNKPSRDEKDTTEIRQKKSKLTDNDHEYECKHGRECDFYPDRDCDRERDSDRGCNRDRSRGRERECDRDRDFDYDWDLDRERDRDGDRHVKDLDDERDRDVDRDRDFDRDRDRVRDGSLDERGIRYKDGRENKKSPDDRSGYDAKPRGSKARYPDMEKKSVSIGRVEPEIDRGRAQSRQAKVDATVSSTMRRASPSSHGGIDDLRQLKPDDLKSRDSVTEQKHRGNYSREPTDYSGASERGGSKYRPAEKPARVDDGHLGDLSVEKSSSKASPMALMEKSPSTSFDCRYMNRSGVKRSLDAEEAGWRNGAREKSTEDRFNWDSALEKPLIDDSKHVDSSTHGSRLGQNNASSLILPPSHRGWMSSPSFIEEDSRVNINTIYKRDGDPPNTRRGQGTPWRGPPNWSSSPLPNGFIPFQHGPPHGGFQAMMPQFPSPLFGVRPCMDMNHPGIPYHFPDSDRFSSHLRPLGWQGSAPSHLHGWDGNNGVFRDEPHVYGGPDWDQNWHPMHGRSEMWKGQNGEVGLDHSVQQTVDDASNVQASQRSQYDNNHFGTTVVEAKESPAKLSPKSLLNTTEEDKPDSSKASEDDHYRAYLSKLDISSELAGPELYGQCMNLQEMEDSAIVDDDNMILVNLKDSRRAIPKRSIMLFSPSLLPWTNDYVFQKAMNHYRKQREENSSLRILKSKTLDLISSNEDKVAEQDQIGEEAAPETDVKMMDAPLNQKSEKLDPGMSREGKIEELELMGISEEKREELDKESISEEKAKELDSSVRYDDVPKDDNSVEAILNEDSKRMPAIPASATGMSTDDCIGDERVVAFGSEPSLILSATSPTMVPSESELVIISRIHDQSTH